MEGGKTNTAETSVFTRVERESEEAAGSDESKAKRTLKKKQKKKQVQGDLGPFASLL